MQTAFLVVVYGFIGLGLAIHILMDEKRCPSTPFELFMIIPFWLPLAVGLGIVKMFGMILPPVEEKTVGKTSDTKA